MGPKEGDEEEEEQENFTRRVEEIRRTREVVQQRERTWRGKGETCCGGRRRGKGGGGRERAFLSPRERSSLGERSFPRERERERERCWKKGEKNVEERRTDQLFFLFDCPCPILPPREASNDRLEKKRRPKARKMARQNFLFIRSKTEYVSRPDRIKTETIKGPF